MIRGPISAGNVAPSRMPGEAAVAATGKSNEIPKGMEEGVLEGISRGLDSIGQNVKEVFFSHMELSTQLKRNQILEHPDKFAVALSRFFTVGTSVVDRTIGREIVKAFDIPACPGLNFETALEIIKRHPRANGSS
jgi:hypothetical protein